ncbi:glucosylglycerol 3-phosphatase [Synechococcus sp. A15-28]|uniref:glucosylglycerol 3-phosphatase n=1 Tax=Synechococcus sp. A15-28 TaxID=1050638 RepID=UPI0016467769|nr:glucosylglycerol 3-phosphatase [Synechococcus sp. A15-28]QNI41944.1 glucosylglycerol 3-phosphatase [Synechococcus sp. A15-28]
MPRLAPAQLLEELTSVEDLLIVQDLDGVCMQLVKDPLTRRMDAGYVDAAADLRGSFVVLTNGEHEGRRGVNRLVESALGDQVRPDQQGLYLPGLAAGGVQLQDRFGQLSHPGVSDAEMLFLASAPQRMEQLLLERLPAELPGVSAEQLKTLAQQAVLDTQVSPTINLNGVFALVPGDVPRQRRLQQMLADLMEQLLQEADAAGLEGSFFLHVAPNLGRDADGRERAKPAAAGDVGTTDIQFMLTGSLKEAGLLVLINQHMARRHGVVPLGEDFNVRTAPRDHGALLRLAQERLPMERMPLLVGVGDTVTSTPTDDGSGWLRGGSDRGFLTLLKALGVCSHQPNRVILVDSSHGEVDRPSLTDGRLLGISDSEDPLELDVLMPGGPAEYISWFQALAQRRRVGGRTSPETA